MFNEVKDKADYLGVHQEWQEHQQRLVTLRDRRKTQQMKEKNNLNNEMYLKNFEVMDDPLDSNNNFNNNNKYVMNNSRDRKKLTNLGSNMLSKRYISQQMQNSFKNKNMSTTSGNLSMLSAALAMSSSQNLSSRMSSRLSLQSKKRLVALHSVDKKNQYLNLQKDLKINKQKIHRDLQWLQEQLDQMSQQDPNLKQKKILNCDFSIYGNCLVTHSQTLLLHSYLYANMAELFDIRELEDLGIKQTIVLQSEVQIKGDKKHKLFSPEDLQAIIRFVNKNSRTFRSSESKHSQISKSFDKDKGDSKQKSGSGIGGSGQQASQPYHQIKAIQHLYDTLNAHVFQVIDTYGRSDQFSEKTQYLLKVPKIQTKKGIFDLVFESQLQQYLSRTKFNYQFHIKEELFQISKSLDSELIDSSSRILNYVVIEERQNCSVLNSQLTLKDFISQYNQGSAGAMGPTDLPDQGQGKQLFHRDEKLLYIFLQAIDLIKKLTKDHKMINYNINPLNLVVTEHYELKLVDFSLIDFSEINHNEDSSNSNSNQTLNKEKFKQSMDSERHYNPTKILMRVQFRNEIKRVSDMLAEGQKSLGEIGIGINQDAEMFEAKLKQVGIKSEVIKQVLAAKKGKQKPLLIQNTDEYFNIMSKVSDPDQFTLRNLVRCFSELFQQSKPGGLMNALKMSQNNIQIETGSKMHSEVLMFIDQIRYQAEITTDIRVGMDGSVLSMKGVNSCQLDIVLNNLEQFICSDLSKEAYNDFIRLFTNSERSSLNELSRLKMAKLLFQVAHFQNNSKLKALCLLTIGDIQKNIKPLLDCLKLYENSQDQVLDNHYYSQLCLSLAREYRKLGGNNNQAKGMFFLEQAFSNNQVNEGDKKSNKTNNEVMLQYYIELAAILTQEDKINQAIECHQKALQISKVLYGEENFNTLECYLNLAQLYEKRGMSAEADLMFAECLQHFDRKDQMLKKKNDFNGSNLSGSVNSKGDDQAVQDSKKLLQQQQKAFGGYNMSIKEKDASIIQRIGIYFRERKEYERACELLERVLEVRKRQFIQKKQQNHQKGQDDEQHFMDNPFTPDDEDDIDQFQGKEFAKLYNDLALTYQGMEDLEYAQEYLVMAIQCLEQLQQDIHSQEVEKPKDSEDEKNNENCSRSIDKVQGLQELADSYLFLADLLRKQANVEQASQAMLKAIEIEQDLPDRLLCLVESYKQLAEDYMVLQDFEQGIQSSELALQIELQIYDSGVCDSNIQETLIFLAEAHQFSGDYVKSNEQLANILDIFTTGKVEVDMQVKTLKLVITNLQNLESYEEAINYQTKVLKVVTDLEEKINIYQQIANNFLQIGDHNQAIQNQVMVYKLVRIIANGGSDEQAEECEETEQTVQALFNLVQIKYMIIQQQVQQANDSGDTSVIDANFLLQTKETLEVLLQRMADLYGEHNLLSRADHEQAEQMLTEINAIIS